MDYKDKIVPSWNFFGPISCVAAFDGYVAHQSTDPCLILKLSGPPVWFRHLRL